MDCQVCFCVHTTRIRHCSSWPYNSRNVRAFAIISMPQMAHESTPPSLWVMMLTRFPNIKLTVRGPLSGGCT